MMGRRTEIAFGIFVTGIPHFANRRTGCASNEGTAPTHVGKPLTHNELTPAYGPNSAPAGLDRESSSRIIGYMKRAFRLLAVIGLAAHIVVIIGLEVLGFEQGRNIYSTALVLVECMYMPTLVLSGILYLIISRKEGAPKFWQLLGIWLGIFSFLFYLVALSVIQLNNSGTGG